jgi:hypothetical protein
MGRRCSVSGYCPDSNIGQLVWHFAIRLRAVDSVDSFWEEWEVDGKQDNWRRAHLVEASAGWLQYQNRDFLQLCLPQMIS